MTEYKFEVKLCGISLIRVLVRVKAFIFTFDVDFVEGTFFFRFPLSFVENSFSSFSMLKFYIIVKILLNKCVRLSKLFVSEV